MLSYQKLIAVLMLPAALSAKIPFSLFNDTKDAVTIKMYNAESRELLKATVIARGKEELIYNSGKQDMLYLVTVNGETAFTVLRSIPAPCGLTLKKRVGFRLTAGSPTYAAQAALSPAPVTGSAARKVSQITTSIKKVDVPPYAK